MMPQTDTGMNAPRPTTRIRQMLRGVVDEARQDIQQVSDPRERALFETTAEVLLGLVKAYEDYERGNEAAWQ
jgi:hypothetical protein